jgi:hypothetical protein
VNADATRPVFPWVTLSLLATLLVLAPYAMSFTPFAGIYTFGTYRAPYDTDPLQTQRVGLVAFGLCATVVAAIEFCVILFRRPALPSILTSVAAWFACAVVGWRSFPYWATGVYAACSGRVPYTDLDPKGLIPMTWLGDLWRLAVLLLYPAALLAIPAGIVGSVLLFRRRAGIPTAIPAACAGIGLLFLLAFSPTYVGWLMD